METPFKKYLDKHQYSNFDLKAVLFDMDGVLYDSMKWHAKSWKQTMDEFEIDSEEDEFYLYEGMVGHKTIAHLIEREEKRQADAEEIDIIYQRKSKLFGEMNDGSLIPKARDMVQLVADKNLTRVIVTGSGQASLLGKLEDNFPGLFSEDKMVTAYDVKHGKPHPEPYLMGLEKAGQLKTNQAIVIENAPRGVEAAVAAGIFTIAINTGPIDPKVLSDAGADIVLPSMEALYDNFEEYFNIIKQA